MGTNTCNGLAVVQSKSVPIISKTNRLHIFITIIFVAIFFSSFKFPIVNIINAQANKSYVLFIVPCLLQQQKYKRKSNQAWLLSQERRDSECFPVNIGVCAAFPSIRASRNSSKGLEERKGQEEMFLDRVADESAIVVFPHFACVTIPPEVMFLCSFIT